MPLTQSDQQPSASPVTVPKVGWLRQHWLIISFWATFAVGIFTRVYQFPNIPAGLNQDEISAGYESWSLLLYGTDRWGAHLPVYFLSWGSGQNVLYSYLTIPFIALFGLTAVAVRSVALIFGIALLPLLYVTVKQWYGRKMALTAMGVLAVIPWGYMTSRWGLESNLLPFFLLLGVYTFSRALEKNARTWVRIISLIPFAIALYAYALGLPTIAVMLVLFLIVYRHEIRAHWRAWLIAAGLFVLIALPFGLFLLKSYVFHSTLSIEKWLPFSLPLLTANRLDQIGGLQIAYAQNIALAYHGFNDQGVWGTMLTYAPIPSLVMVLALVELIALLFGLRYLPHLKRPNVFDIWLLACIPLVLFIRFDLNQGNAIYLPLIVFAVRGLRRLALLVKNAGLRNLLIAIVAILVIVPAANAYDYYVDGSYEASAPQTFNPQLRQALITAAHAAGNKPLYISPSIPLAYVQTLWYLRIPAKVLQAGKVVPSSNNNARDFLNFRFEAPQSGQHGYYFVSLTNDPVVCAAPTTVQKFPNDQIIYCP